MIKIQLCHWLGPEIGLAPRKCQVSYVIRPATCDVADLRRTCTDSIPDWPWCVRSGTSCSRSGAGPEEFPDLRQGCVPIIQSSSKSSRAHGLVLTVGLLNCLAAIKIVCFALSLI